MKKHHATDIKITCKDGYSLAATLYLPEQAQKGGVLITPATGIKRQFYTNFASYLAKNGYGVISFDYRGIAESLVGEINHSDVSLQCWGEKDMPAILEHLKLTFPKTKYHLVGHSAGGQLVGLMHNASELTSIFNFACSSGHLKNMKLVNQIKHTSL